MLVYDTLLRAGVRSREAAALALISSHAPKEIVRILGVRNLDEAVNHGRLSTSISTSLQAIAIADSSDMGPGRAHNALGETWVQIKKYIRSYHHSDRNEIKAHWLAHTYYLERPSLTFEEDHVELTIRLREIPERPLPPLLTLLRELEVCRTLAGVLSLNIVLSCEIRGIIHAIDVTRELEKRPGMPG